MRASGELKNLIQESALSLPTLPSVFVAVLERITEEKTSADDIARIIERDQSLAARVLAVSNSSAYGFRDEISTVSRAVVLLGFDVIKNLALSISVFDDFFGAKDIKCFEKTKFWEHCLICAAVAREIAQQMKIQFAEELYVAGLLHDMGKVALDSAAGDTYSNLLKEASASGAVSLALEQEFLGTDHAEIAGLLSEKWKLPGNIAAAIRYHHEMPDTGVTKRHELMAAVVAAADYICWTQGFGSVDGLQPPYLSDRAQKLIEIKKLDIERICEAMDRQIMSTAELFDLSIPDKKEFRKALMRANAELGHINSLYADAKHQLERQVQELSCLNRAIYQIRQDLDVAATTKALLQAIRDELGYSRTLFFKVHAKSEKFYLADFLVTGEMEMDYSTLEFDFNEHNPLSLSLEKKRALSLRRKPEWESDPLFTNLDTDEIFVIPIPLKHGFVGVLTADRYRGQRSLSAGSLEPLNILAQEAGLAIENAELFEKTRQLATRDDLTDLYNRRHCSQCLESEIRRSQRYGHPLSVVMFDIDYFKKINDTFGHQEGDKVLKIVAQLLTSCSRETDLVGRYGGEEFLAVLPETAVEGAKTFSERIRKAVEEFGKSDATRYSRTNLTISGGIAGLDPGRDTVETLLGRADQALYKAKQNGRNRIITF